MASTYSDRLHLELQADGENQGTWGQIANTQFKLLEEASAGVGTVAHDNSADYTLVSTNGTESVDSTTNVARNFVLNITGALTEARNLVVPTEEKPYIVKNGTTGGYAVTVKTSGGSGISVPNGEAMVLYCDGTNVVSGLTSLSSGATINGVAIADLTSSQTLSSKTLTSPVIDTGVSGTAFLDDDTFATATATTFASAESTKAYIDNAIAALVEAGTLALFQQTAAPTNWTKQATHNNKALRVVSGTASSGGNDNFSTVFGSSKTTASHTLTVDQIPAHTHSYFRDDDSVGSFNQNNGTGTQQNAATTGSTGGGSGHSHNLTIDLEYVDIIIASKDAY